MPAIKQVPPLERKTRKIDLESLTAALFWDKLAEMSLGDNDIPLAPGDGIAEEEEGGGE